MAFVLRDRIQQLATANTTSSFTLTGTVTGFRPLTAVLSNGDTTYYAATDASGNWEVGEGTYQTTGSILIRSGIYDSNTGGAITFVGTVTVFITYPADASLLLDPLGNLNTAVTIPAGSVWNGNTIGVAYGGTGVNTDSGANSVVLRNASQNVVFNNFIAGYASTTASAGTTVLTVASARNQVLVGSTTHTFQLPNATTLALGQSFLFINNSSGNLTVVDNSSTVVEVVPPGGITQKGAISIATSAGTWGAYSFIPAYVNWGTNTLNLATTVISGGTWQGGTIGTAYGGTGLTTFAAANNAIYSTSASALAAGTLPVAAGGTGVTTSTGSGSVVRNTNPTISGGATIENTTQAIEIGSGQTSGIITIGHTAVSSSGTITLGQSTGSQIVNIANGANPSGTKTVNIGTNSSGGPTNINIGSGTGTSTTILNGTVRPNALTASLPVFTDASKNLVSTGTVAGTNGGTGQSTYAVGDLLQGGATNTLTKLAAVATGNALISGGVTTASSWGKIGLTTHVSGTLPVANGGTNASAAGITAFNNITGYTAAGATGTTSTNLVFSTSPTFTTSIDGGATFGAFASSTALTIGHTGTGAASTTNIATAALTGAFAKTVNIGTGGTTGSTTTINIGTSIGCSTIHRGSLVVGSVTASTTDGAIFASNNITAFAASDIKFKTNIQTITNAVEKVQLIGGKTFDWTDEYMQAMGGEDSYFMRKSDAGVIAQDVHKAIPELTREREDGSLAVDYPKLVALAFAAIAELKAEIDELKKDK
jgi:hypothetical protein